MAYFHQRARQEHHEDTRALAMGDFNDEPFDTSLVTHALSTRQQRRVLEADTPRFWNLMWPVTGLPDGTFYFDNTPTSSTSSSSTSTWPSTTAHCAPTWTRSMSFGFPAPSIPAPTQAAAVRRPG